MPVYAQYIFLTLIFIIILVCSFPYLPSDFQEWLIREFSKPVFPPLPDLTPLHLDVVKTWEDEQGFHTQPDLKRYEELDKNHPYLNEWKARVRAVHLPFWWKLWCHYKKRSICPSLPGLIQLAMDAIPLVDKETLAKNSSVHLSGTFDESGVCANFKIAKGGVLLIDGGPEIVTGFCSARQVGIATGIKSKHVFIVENMSSFDDEYAGYFLVFEDGPLEGNGGLSIARNTRTEMEVIKDLSKYIDNWKPSRFKIVRPAWVHSLEGE